MPFLVLVTKGLFLKIEQSQFCKTLHQTTNSCESYRVFWDIENTCVSRRLSAYEGLKSIIHFIDQKYGEVVGNESKPCGIWTACQDQATCNKHTEALNQCGAKMLKVNTASTVH